MLLLELEQQHELQLSAVQQDQQLASLPPLLARGGIPFQGLATLLVFWLLVLMLTQAYTE